MKAQSGGAAKTSAVEIAVLLVLCLFAGLGAGLAFESALAGLAVAAIGLVAVVGYGVVGNIGHRPRVRRESPQRLSVTEIAVRRREAPNLGGLGPETSESASTSEPDGPADVAKVAEPERVVPFRAQSIR